MRKEAKGNSTSQRDTISVNYADTCEESKDEPESDLEDEIQGKDGKPTSKAEVKKIWDIILDKVPSDYTFQVKTGENTY